MSKNEIANSGNVKGSEPANIETRTIEEAKTPPASDAKATVIKCIALALGAALLIYSFSSCLGKISDTNNSIAEGYAKPSAVQADNSFGSNDTFADAGVEDSTAPEQTFNTDEPAEETPYDSGVSEDVQTEKSDAPKNISEDKKGVPVKKPTTKEEIVSYFNTAVNKIKPNAKSVTFVNDESYQAGGIDLAKLGMFESVVDALIKSFMGPNKEKVGKTLTTFDEKVAYLPVENEKWMSKLTAADLKDAKCTEKDGIYTITLKVMDDGLSDNPTNGSNHHTRAFSVVKAGDINKNAGAAKSLLTGLKTGYKNGTIICNIDSKTGNVLSVSLDYVWILHVDSFGGVDAPFGGRQAFDIKW